MHILFLCLAYIFSNTPVADAGYGITNFVTLYLIGSFLHIFGKCIKKTYLIFIYVLSTLLTFVFSLVSSRAWAYNSIFVLITSISFFEIFRYLKVKQNGTINSLAKYTFAVYLIDVNDFFSVFFIGSYFWVVIFGKVNGCF